MEFEKFACGADDEEKRIDRVLRRFLPEMPLGTIYKNIRSGFIRVNGKKVSQNYRILPGDELWLSSVLMGANSKTQPAKIEKTEKTNQMEKTGRSEKMPDCLNKSETQKAQNAVNAASLDIVFKNEHLLVVNKPYGISSQGGENTKNGGEISVDDMVKKLFAASIAQNAENPSASLSFSPGPLHRLDKNTSGLLVFSQSTAGARWFSEKIASHNLQKIYLGVVQGNLPQKQTWQNYILQGDNKEKGFKTVKIAGKNNAQNGKIAITHVTPLAYGNVNGTNLTLCQFIIETGRKHQIRAQSAFNGFALAGDSAYKSAVTLPPKCGRQFFLHAYKLVFAQNDAKREELKVPLNFQAKLPKDFRDFLDFAHFDFSEIE